MFADFVHVYYLDVFVNPVILIDTISINPKISVSKTDDNRNGTFNGKWNGFGENAGRQLNLQMAMYPDPGVPKRSLEPHTNIEARPSLHGERGS
jgi:hypothetical protein